MKTIPELNALVTLTGDALKQANKAHAQATEELRIALKEHDKNKTLYDTAKEASSPLGLDLAVERLKLYFDATKGLNLGGRLIITDIEGLSEDTELLRLIVVAAGGELINYASSSMLEVSQETGNIRLDPKLSKSNKRYTAKLIRRFMRPDIFNRLVAYGFKQKDM